MRNRFIRIAVSILLLFTLLGGQGQIRAAAKKVDVWFNGTEAKTFLEVGNYKTNVSCAFSEELALSAYVSVDVLKNAETKSYVSLNGMDLETAIASGMQILFIPTAKVFQIVWGRDLSAYQVGMTLQFAAGMPVYYETNGKTERVTLKENAIYEISRVDLEGNALYIRLRTDYSKATFGGEWSFITRQNYLFGSQSTGLFANIRLANCALTSRLTDATIDVDTSAFVQYVDYCGVPAAEALQKGVRLRFYINSLNKVLQLQIATDSPYLADGKKIVFKQGMPVGGYTSTGEFVYFTLDETYEFVVSENEDSVNGFMITRVREVMYGIPGDIDGDFLKNENDIQLLRKDLVGALAIKEAHLLDTNEDANYDLKDYMHAIKGWNVSEEEAYISLYEDQEVRVLAAGQEQEYELNVTLGNWNYIRLTYHASESLLGTFRYSDPSGNVYEEEFFLDKEEVQFEQFFDNYRWNGLNVEGKMLQSILLRSTTDSEVRIQLLEVSVADRQVKTDDMLYISNENLKVGVDLNMGGTLAYMESLKYQPVELKDTRNKEIRIEADYEKKSGEEILDTHVNLINIYDWGRQVQQSYYIDVQDADYEHGSYVQKDVWPYNPVQAGDQYLNQSQIIDYRVVNGDDCVAIYVKTRAMDWAKNNSTTRSYMENWYRLEDNALLVDNAFINWEGFETIGEKCSQELPAFYTGPSFDYFVEGNDTSKRTNYTGPSWMHHRRIGAND